jgi:D-alanyl-D-alanine carboxypeptidase
MHPFKFLAFVAFAYFSLVVVFGSSSESPPETTIKVPQTVQIVPLTDEQIADQEALIAQMIAEENATIYDEPVETTTTLVQLAQIDPDTQCQEWLPLAVEMGWPNETEVLQRLGQVMWKESRCQAISAESKWFNGHDWGLTQINQIHEEWLSEMGWTLEDMAIPSSNLRFAYLLWNAREEQGKCGWQPWSLPC